MSQVDTHDLPDASGPCSAHGDASVSKWPHGDSMQIVTDDLPTYRKPASPLRDLATPDTRRDADVRQSGVVSTAVEQRSAGDAPRISESRQGSGSARAEARTNLSHRAYSIPYLGIVQVLSIRSEA